MQYDIFESFGVEGVATSLCAKTNLETRPHRLAWSGRLLLRQKTPVQIRLGLPICTIERTSSLEGVFLLGTGRGIVYSISR